MECRAVLLNVGIHVDNYFSSEIDKHALESRQCKLALAIL